MVWMAICRLKCYRLVFLACDELTGLFSMNKGYLKFLMLKQINNCASLGSKEA